MASQLETLRLFYFANQRYATVDVMTRRIRKTLGSSRGRARAIAIRWAHQLAGRSGY